MLFDRLKASCNREGDRYFGELIFYRLFIWPRWKMSFEAPTETRVLEMMLRAMDAAGIRSPANLSGSQ